MNTNDAAAPALLVENTSMAFSGQNVLHDVTLKIPGAGIVAIVGPNGAGKTTLFNIISGALRPQSGSVYSFGHRLTGKSPEAIAALGVYRTFQDLRLFRNLSVRENVCVGLGRALRRVEIRNRVDAILEEFGLADQERLPAAEIAYGAAKLLTVARALAHEPAVLLLDEPGAGMDARSYDTLGAALRRRPLLTIIIVEHNLDTVRDLASRVVFLGEGRILADGTPGDVLTRTDLADVYFGAGVGSRR